MDSKAGVHNQQLESRSDAPAPSLFCQDGRNQTAVDCGRDNRI